MVTTRSSGAQKRKALVTGGNGFLGQHLVRQLVSSGLYEVTVLDIRDTGDSAAHAVRVADLRDAAAVATAVAGQDVVFHCATAAPTGANALNNQLMYSVNVDGTRNVIAACKQHGVTRLVSAGSLWQPQ
jgi:sterol-4alpha-carboxylate 3-dehydrogenase (decarboxylating)